MRFQQFFFVFFIFMMSLLINGQTSNLAMRRKLHRLSCHQRRCMPLHSRVPFP
ncbi:apelin receptor early endogenous ligand [Rhinolophus sinicus]|uniref:apelin receptor early endogenous ligand n=1 Tax=Rhinolophus sinicus TaxID=89399 RepID=UPI000944089A|nr:PREDICTED: apelin receptor early endogenous ligand-like [Rhinolophus sinicus]